MPSSNQLFNRLAVPISDEEEPIFRFVEMNKTFTLQLDFINTAATCMKLIDCRSNCIINNHTSYDCYHVSDANGTLSAISIFATT